MSINIYNFLVLTVLQLLCKNLDAPSHSFVLLVEGPESATQLSNTNSVRALSSSADQFRTCVYNGLVDWYVNFFFALRCPVGTFLSRKGTAPLDFGLNGVLPVE